MELTRWYMIDSIKTKLLILLISVGIVCICVLLFFLDNSLEWGIEKIIVCGLVNLWIFFITPSLRRAYILNRHKSQEEWLKLGIEFGASRIALPVLLAPYFGLIYYFTVHFSNE